MSRRRKRRAGKRISLSPRRHRVCRCSRRYGSVPARTSLAWGPTRGQQELPSEILECARLFCDLPEQSIQIGEIQHVRERVESGEFVLNAIGAVLEGRCPGRISRDDITVFDSSGIALQDLYIGQFLLSASKAAPSLEYNLR